MREGMFPIAVLAGGLATRLHPLTQAIPKALIDVGGEPFIAHQLRLLRDGGLRRIVLCVGHLGEQIHQVVGDGARFGVEVAYSFDGPRLLGTAGAVRRALPLLGGAFFVLYGDTYLPCDFAAVQAAFTDSGRHALMTVFRNDDRWDTSNVEFADGSIVAYDKAQRSPRMRHIDYGLGVFAAAAFDRVPEQRPHDLASLYRDLLERRELAAYEVTQRFYEIGSAEGLEETRRYLGTARRPSR